jgi:leucyl aminopeptidase (aminopeptidase T)
VGLQAASEAALDCVGVRGDDVVAVLFNAEQRAIGEALVESSRRRTDAVRVVEFAALSRHGEEPPSEVADAMLAADVVLAPTSMSLSHTQARLAATRRGARIATMPTITEDIFIRTLPVDDGQVSRISRAVSARLTAASHARLASRAGTDILLTLAGREGQCDEGQLQEPGAFGNLPAGEGYIAPVETFGTGTIVMDGSLAGYGRLAEPMRITVRDGRAIQATGDAGQWLMNTLDGGGQYGRSLAELGIGTNQHAELTGNVLEDEKAIGTAHLAFGASIGMGGANSATVHIDGVMLDVCVELDGEVLLIDRTLKIP